MSWIAIIALSIAIITIVTLMSGRLQAARRRDRLEDAFFRARGQRLVSHGIRSHRF